MPIITCLNTSTIQPQPLMEKIRLAAAHGFQAIELWLNDVFEYVERGGRVTDVVNAVADAGLHVPSTIAMKGWGDAPAETYPAALDECKRRMALAAELGATYVVATPPLEPADLNVVSVRYRDLLRVGKSLGVKATMEYLGFCRSVYRIDQALAIVVEANDQDATLVLDSFHTFRGGSSREDLERVPVERIAHFHIDDAPRMPPRDEQMDPDRVMPGDGILDLAGEMAVLKAKGYAGAVSLELFNRGLWQKDPNEVLAVGMERLRALLG